MAGELTAHLGYEPPGATGKHAQREQREEDPV
jgi:hypothetical protein